MVAALNVSVNYAVDDVGLKLLTNNKIINSPPHIALPKVAALVLPKSVFYFLGIEVPERINKALFQERSKIGPFLRRVARNFVLSLRVVDVYFVVGYVEVAAENYWFSLGESFQVPYKILIPFLGPIIKSPQSLPRKRHIGCN